MAFRFKRKEDFADGFSRIAAEQVKRAVREWENPDRAVAVHETRKCIKRLRALLRLVKPVLAADDFRAENAFLRDIAASLSVSRDLQVMSQTIAELGKEASSGEAEHLEILKRLMADAMSTAHPCTQPNLKKTTKALRESAKRLSKLKLSASAFDVVASGFEQTYRQGRRRMEELSAGHSDEASHDWRKRVQAHWRQLNLLRPAWPELFDARIDLARKLAEALGRDHDLALLADYTAGPASEALGAKGVLVVARLIERKQEEIRQLTLSDGRLLYADTPRGLTKQIRRLWQVAAKRADAPK